MNRKETEKEPERAHYYSQFWLDVAAGRRVIGQPKQDGEVELAEEELELPPLRRANRGSSVQEDHRRFEGGNNGHAQPIEPLTHAVVEPMASPDEGIEPHAEELDANENEVVDYQNAEMADTDIPDMNLSPIVEEIVEEIEEIKEEEDFYDEEEEEEEEDADWGGRGRKKSKATRPVKPARKPVKRDTRRPPY